MKALFQAAAAAAAAAAWLIGCQGGAGGEDARVAVTVQGEVPVAYARRSTALSLNPTNGAPFAPGGDLMLREKSSPSAPEHNLTATITQGQGDVSDPEVSYDGKRIVFALRCPAGSGATVGGASACTGRWNLWLYTLGPPGELHKGTLQRLTGETDSDDVDPVFLPAGRGFVFSSNRQGTSRTRQALGRNYLALDEYERERVFNLHTMAADGSAVTQISVNQSHDRNPVIRPNGDILFSRWEHVAGRNRFSIFRARPDGTDLFVLYGAHSSGNSFLHPRDMDPQGAFKGQLITSLMPLSGTQEGGALVRVDALNYSEQNTPANRTVPTEGGQRSITTQELAQERALSPYGRATSPYPLWDGSDRILVAWRPCELTRDGVVIPCANLTEAERTRLTSERSRSEIAADPVQDDAPAAYGIFMFDPARQTWLSVAPPPAGFMHVDPVALVARPEPAVVEATSVDAALARRGMALFEVRSVYDTDQLGRMGDAVLAPADLEPGCSEAIAKTRPTEPIDARPQIADLARMKDPADPAYRCGPARLLRVIRAVAPPSSAMGLRNVIGDTDFEQVQILGYVPIEPDGSVKFEVPADTPLALSVVDAQGRSFQTHTNWLQLRPGERRTCDGCHSPRRGGSINAGEVVDQVPAAWRVALSVARAKGETMAATRTRLDPAALALAADAVAVDSWADTSRAGVQARRSIALRYDQLATPAPQQGVINYPEHIQPLWARDRGAGSCLACHGSGARLDLSATVAGSGRLVSYDQLLTGPALLGPDGRVLTRLDEDGVPVIRRAPALVDTAASEGEALGLARKSRLVEILSGQSLKAGSAARTAHPTPTSPNHAGLLNASEMRLLAEWIDGGGQYLNDPFDASGRVRQVNGLDAARFATQVLPVLRAQCQGCHQPQGSGGSSGSGRSNRLVLTGDPEGDFNVAATLVSDLCNPAANALLRAPSTAPHPAAGQAAVLGAGSAGYQAIAAWIQAGCGR
ncbi:MAG: hypothetical protein JNM08_16405 [Rubrivivax sp.]|nr:hypothetical protein [Rubrivivax sp.]